jgi:hypothetical protein
MWGEDGLRDITDRMPPSSRGEMLRETGSEREWIAEAHVIAWCFAVWEGPANRDRAIYFELLKRQTDLGFGRIRRFFLSMATPSMLFAKAPSMWSQDHTHGTLECAVEGTSAIVTLRDHPYTETPQARATIAEVFRYTISLANARGVTESHALEQPGVLRVKIRWV